MSAGRASQLEEESWNVIPGLFQALVSYGRPVLLEVGCDSDSLLTKTVQEQVGWMGAAQRASIWNGADLGTSQGVRLILDKIQMDKPGTVWLAPPSGAFSPFQKANVQSADQSDELKRKREQAKRMYAGAAIVYRFCMQQGIHCVWEMPEKSDAWRLPVLQDLQRKCQPYVAVTHGCQVGLRSEDGKKLLKKGWKILTSHAKLAETFQQTCRCHRSYVHGRCEGAAVSRSAKYTPQLVHKVTRALLLELSQHDVKQECLGQTQLPEMFGTGLTCQCKSMDLATHDKCGSCLVSRFSLQSNQASGNSGNPKPKAVEVTEDPSFGPEDPGEAVYSAQQVCQSEQQAQNLIRKKDYSHASCEQLIRTMPLKAQVSRQGKLGEHRVLYFAFGAYAHGAQYGVTSRTKVFPQCIKYFNNYLKHHGAEQQKWTSLVVNINQGMPLHRDVNNQAQRPNLMIGVSQYQQGGLWVQETVQAREMNLPLPKEKTLSSRVTPHGETIWGHVWGTQQQLVQFPPKAWHATEPWEGERIVVSAYTSRGQGALSQEELQQLRLAGFPMPPQPNRTAHEVYAVEGRERDREKETERLKRQLYLLHAATGHCSTKHLLEALKRRNANPEILKLAAEFKCSICEERKKVSARHVASLEPLPPKFHTVSADVGHWRHPRTGAHHQFLMVLDEGSRFRMAKILSSGAKQQPSGATCMEYFHESWAQVFGNPRTLRLDPAGSFRSEAVSDYCHRHNIYLDLVPGEAHWKIGACEQAIQGIKLVMSKLCDAEDTLSAEEALSTAVRTFNQRDLIRGFAPVQHVLGQVPDETGRIEVGKPSVPPELLIENPNTEFPQAVARRAEAEKAHADWNAQQRLKRAANSRSRPTTDYYAGELVFYWRQQDSAKNRQGPNTKRGYFMGPARILATENRRNPDGTLQPGSSVWCVRGRQLIKCCVEQLRRASQREELVESLLEQDPTPWNFTRVADQIGGNQYQDFSNERPSEDEWWRSQDATEERQPSRHRIRGKRPAVIEPTMDSDEELLPDDERTRSSGSRQRPRREHERGECWWAQVHEDVWQESEQAYWQDEGASVEVEVNMPENPHQWNRALQDLQCYMVGALKRRAVEVREKNLSEDERKQFAEAKGIEVRNFIAAKAFECLPAELAPNQSQAIGMGWILTWKYREDGSRKAKARAVLLGYQDPAYEHRSTTAPVMSRQSRQMLLQQAANRSWTVYKGDVSGAFLQSREYPSHPPLHSVRRDL